MDFVQADNVNIPWRTNWNSTLFKGDFLSEKRDQHKLRVFAMRWKYVLFAAIALIVVSMRDCCAQEDSSFRLNTLIKQLASSDPKEVCEAAIELRSYGPEAVVAIPQLVKLLDVMADAYDKNQSPNRQARRTIRVLDKHAVQPLIDSLNEKDIYKGAVVQLLGEINDKRAVPALLKVAFSDNSEAQYLAFDALGEIKDRGVVEILLKWLKERDRDVEFRKNVIRSLGKLQDNRAVDPLITILQDKKTPEDIQCLIAAVMSDFNDPKAFEPLLQIYKQPPSNAITIYILEAMGSTKDPRAFDILKQNIADSRAIREAIRGLSKLGDKQAISLLKEMLHGESQWKYNVGYIATALVDSNDESAIASVENYLKTHPIIDIYDRRPMVDSLVMSSNPRAYRNAIAFLNAKDNFYVKETTRVLSQSMTYESAAEDGPIYEGRKLPALNDPEVLKALVQVAKNPKTNASIRGYAIWALEKSGMYDIRRKLAEEDKKKESVGIESQKYVAPENEDSNNMLRVK